MQEANGAGTTLLLAPDVDALAMLQRAAAVGRVIDFGLSLPPLSQLFRDAVKAPV